MSHLPTTNRHQIYKDLSTNTFTCAANTRTKIPIFGNDPISGTLPGIPDNFGWDKANHKLVPSSRGGDPKAFFYQARLLFDAVGSKIGIKVIVDAAAVGGGGFIFIDTRYLGDTTKHSFGFHFPFFAGNVFIQNGCNFGITASADILVSNVSLYIVRNLLS